jgi:MFS family permease
MLAGFWWTPLFSAHWVERLSRFKPVVLFVSLFQRLVFLMAGILLLFFGEGRPLLALAVLALAQFLSGSLGGITNTAWMGLVAKTVPENRRSSLWALRYILQSVIGFIAGGAVVAVLSVCPGVRGYGVLHLITFGFLMISFVVFAQIREPEEQPTARPAEGFGETLCRLKGILLADVRLRRYIAGTMLMKGNLLMLPFLSIRTLDVLGKGESYLGFLVTLQMAGGILGNLHAGRLGDRSGGKRLLLISAALYALSAAAAAIGGAAWLFLPAFFLLGAAMSYEAVGCMTLNIDLCPKDQRPTYQAAIWAFNLPAMLGAALLSSALWDLSGGRFALLAWLAVFATLAALLQLGRMREPRKISP